MTSFKWRHLRRGGEDDDDDDDDIWDTLLKKEA
jgi:hypothetical protein